MGAWPVPSMVVLMRNSSAFSRLVTTPWVTSGTPDWDNGELSSASPVSAKKYVYIYIYYVILNGSVYNENDFLGRED